MTGYHGGNSRNIRIKSRVDNRLDYYNSDNEGHSMVKMSAEKTLTLSRGDKFVQGIFIPCGLAEEDEVTEVRNGGFGSTGK